MVCYGTKAKIENAPIIKDKYLNRLLSTLADDYTIFPWHTLTEADRDFIKSVMKTHPLTRKYNPFVEEEKLEPLNSLGLRYQDKVVGWTINHRTAPDTIRYTNMYVHPDYQPLSRSVLFLAKALRLQYQVASEIPKATF